VNGALAEESMQIVRVAAPVRSQVVEHLRRAIIEQRFPPGQRLAERELERLVAAIKRREGAATARAAERHVHAARRVALTTLAENWVTA
jgi:DNA-binding GntR family transcriptional regulator